MDPVTRQPYISRNYPRRVWFLNHSVRIEGGLARNRKEAKASGIPEKEP